jgi:hypothetical protein
MESASWVKFIKKITVNKKITQKFRLIIYNNTLNSPAPIFLSDPALKITANLSVMNIN